MAVAGTTSAWAGIETRMRCGVDLGAADLKHREYSGKKTEYSDYERSLAGPRLEKLKRMTEAESFKIPATQQLLPEMLTLANVGCILRF